MKNKTLLITVFVFMISLPSLLAQSDPDITLNITHETCEGDGDGMVVLEFANTEDGILPCTTYDFSWYFDENENGIFEEGEVVADDCSPTGLESGNYHLEVVNGGCQAEGDFVVEAGTSIEIQQLTTTPTFFQSNTGSIQVTFGQIAGSFTVQLLDEDNNEYPSTPPGTDNVTFENLYAGDYIFIVFNEEGCATELQATVGECNMSFIEETIVQTCEGESAGSITVSIGEITGIYEIEWQNSSGNQLQGSILNLGVFALENIPPDTYTLTITDTNGCSITRSYSTFIEPYGVLSGYV